MYKLHKAVQWGASYNNIEESIICESENLDDLYDAFNADVKEYIDKHNQDEYAECELDCGRYWAKTCEWDPDNIDKWECTDMLDTLNIGSLEYLWEKY